MRLAGRGDPAGVGVEEEEENHAERHEIHVDQQQDAAVVEAPSALHTADGVCGAGYSEECGEDEKRSGAVVGKVGEEDGYGETYEDEDVAPEKGTPARIEKAGEHTILIRLDLILFSFDYVGTDGGAAGAAAGDGAAVSSWRVLLACWTWLLRELQQQGLDL